MKEDFNIEIKVIGVEDTRTVFNQDGTTDQVSIIIPDCCREGWDSCPHVINRKAPQRKRNIGL